MAAAKGNRYSSSENRTQIVRDTLRRIAKQNPKKLRAACLKLLDKAEQGDVSAFKEFTDRLDGKAIQPTEISGPNGSPIVIASSESNVV